MKSGFIMCLAIIMDFSCFLGVYSSQYVLIHLLKNTSLAELDHRPLLYVIFWAKKSACYSKVWNPWHNLYSIHLIKEEINLSHIIQRHSFYFKFCLKELIRRTPTKNRSQSNSIKIGSNAILWIIAGCGLICYGGQAQKLFSFFYALFMVHTVSPPQLYICQRWLKSLEGVTLQVCIRCW